MLGMLCIDVVFVVGFVKMVSRYDFLIIAHEEESHTMQRDGSFVCCVK